MNQSQRNSNHHRRHHHHHHQHYHLIAVVLLLAALAATPVHAIVGHDSVPLQQVLSHHPAAVAPAKPCDNFYAHACGNAAVNTSHFRTLAQHHRGQLEAWLHETPLYHACMAAAGPASTTQRLPSISSSSTSSSSNSPTDEAAALLRGGWTHPLRISVTPSLAGPAYAVDLGLEPALYTWYATLVESSSGGGRHDDAAAAALPGWAAHVYESHAFRHWLASMFQHTEAAAAAEEDEEDRQTALAGLVDYVHQYESYADMRGHLSKRAACVLDGVLGYTPGSSDTIWMHRNGMPHAVLEAILLTSIEHTEAMRRDLGRLTLQLLEEEPPRGYLYHAAWLEDGVPPALRAHFRQRTLPDRLRRQPLLFGHQHRHPLSTAADTAEDKKGGNRSALCTRMARAVHMAPMNRVFFEENNQAGGGMQARRDAAHELVRAIRTRLRRLVEQTRWLHPRTRDAALAKLDALAIYVLEPPREETEQEKESAPFRARHYAEGVAAWLRQRADAQWALLAANRDIHSLADYDRVAREQLAEQWFHEVNYEIVNAWYDPTRNTITLPPGILFAPIYRGENDVGDLASMGTIIGHEMGHSLDVSGRFFDQHGFYVMPEEQEGAPVVGWWRDHDVDGFQAHMTCLANEFGHPCERDDYGMHTMGEDMADQLGILASHALTDEWLGMDQAVEQAFFEGYAHLWCAHLSHEQQCERVEGDVHALPQHRVNKALRQLPSFARAFDCTAEDGMVNTDQCLIY